MNASELGRLGEDLALSFYRIHGYRCLDRRWRRGGGEIDLVLCRDQVTVFVEVKSRGPRSLGRAAEAVSPYQLQRLRQLARRWCWERGGHVLHPRLDVVTVDALPEGRGMVLRHYPGVD